MMAMPSWIGWGPAIYGIQGPMCQFWGAGTAGSRFWGRGPGGPRGMGAGVKIGKTW